MGSRVGAETQEDMRLRWADITGQDDRWNDTRAVWGT